MRSPLIVAALLAALSACSTPAASTPPVPAPASSASASSADPVNAAACEQFAKASDPLSAMGQMIGPGPSTGSMIIASHAGAALETMRGASGLARGDVQSAMERAVAAVQIIQEGAASSVDGSVDMADQLQTLRLTLADVVTACQAAGADVVVNA
jgi:hypothetical protein